MNASELRQALTLLEKQLPYCTTLEGQRLNVIIDKLRRFTNGDIYHPDDLTAEENKLLAINNLKKYIKETYDSCQDLKDRCSREGISYYYHDWAEVPGVDFETFSHFIESDDCLCGTCQPN